jgi:hypothetical protein
MGLGLIGTATPDLYKEDNQPELPIESINKTDKTAYLRINLQVKAKGGQPVVPMTAVFAPNPAQMTGKVNVLLWLHGDKKYWQSDGQNKREFWGESIQFYLNNLPMCKLREFILKTSQTNFLLVAPTLNDHTGVSVDADHGNYEPGALQWDAGDASAYLQQAINGANKYLGIPGTAIGNIVLAAHSGGGHLQGQMASSFAGDFTKINEVWCFDSMYWGSDPFINWAGKGHSNPRLWAYATKATTARNANRILELLNQPTTPKGKKTQPDPRALKLQSSNVEVLIDHSPVNGKPASSNGAWAAYGGGAGGHYEGMPKYLPTLVKQSQNLK